MSQPYKKLTLMKKQHILSLYSEGLPVGVICSRTGMTTASVSGFLKRILGRNGHKDPDHSPFLLLAKYAGGRERR